MFASEQASVVRLIKPNDIIDKMAYAHANPCAADLVEHDSEWPGVTSVEAIVMGRGLTASRPAHFFQADGTMPPVVSLTFARPGDSIPRDTGAAVATGAGRLAGAGRTAILAKPGLGLAAGARPLTTAFLPILFATRTPGRAAAVAIWGPDPMTAAIATNNNARMVVSARDTTKP